MNIKNPTFKLIAVLFFLTRLIFFIASPYDIVPGYGDYWNFYNQAQLGIPFLHFWTEFPPLFPFISRMIFLLVNGSESAYSYVLALVISLFQAGTIAIFFHLEEKLHLEKKGISLLSDFNISEVDAGKNKIISYDQKELDYDLLVSVPTNMGAEVIERSNMGDELNFVPTHKNTLQTKKWENVWIIGDAGNVPASKAGSVAHFMLDVVIENILRAIEGLEPLPHFDGHANCFIESGFDKGILIDFNYDVEPLPGKYPLPGFGPFSLLQESAANHWGKMTFRWLYWNVLLKGGELPFESQMSMAGKWQ